MEIDAHIKRDHHVIFGWDLLNWALKSDCVLGNHYSDVSKISTMAEATLKAWFDNTSSLTETLAQSIDTIRHKNVRCARAPEAADSETRIINNAKKWDTSSSVSLVDRRRAVLDTIDVLLDEMSPSTEVTLDCIIQLVHLCEL
jgi:hypothetical protein